MWITKSIEKLVFMKLLCEAVSKKEQYCGISDSTSNQNFPVRCISVLKLRWMKPVWGGCSMGLTEVRCCCCRTSNLLHYRLLKKIRNLGRNDGFTLLWNMQCLDFFRCGVVGIYLVGFRYRKGPCTLLLHMAV